MKKRNLFIIYLLLLPFYLVFSQSEYTVTSNQDNGSGTLRQLVGNVESGDIISIPENYSITLDSAIVISKHLTIKGHGASVKVKEPGISATRLFTLHSAGSTIFNITIENLKLEGGDIRLNTDPVDKNATFGGAILITKRINLSLLNCEISNSQAIRGGAFHVSDGVGVSVLIDNCVFQDNKASEYGGAISFLKSQSSTDASGQAIIKNTIFERNSSTGSAAVTMNMPAEFSNCLFKDNISTGVSRGSCVFQVNDNPSSNVKLESCTFAGNKTGATDPASNQDGGIFVAQKGPTTTYFLTNCTFYDNHGGRGAIYLFAGKLFMVNCTVAGNIAYNRSNYGGGFYGTTDATAERKEAILVNNIFAYNYSMVVPAGATDTIHNVLDTYFGAKPIIYAEKNIIASSKSATDAPVNIVSPVAFFYDDQDAAYDDYLFENYTINKFKHKIPVYNETTRTIALKEDGVGTGVALSKDMVIDPEIEALIPNVDQRGEVRSSINPSLGSYEYNTVTAVRNQMIDKPTFLLRNPIDGEIHLKDSHTISWMDMFDLMGRKVFSKINPNVTEKVESISSGQYIIRFESKVGVSTEKLIVR